MEYITASAQPTPKPKPKKNPMMPPRKSMRLVVPAVLSVGEVLKACAFRQVSEMNRSCRAVALFGDDDLSFILGVRIGLAVFITVVIRLAMNEGDDVGVLLDRSRFAEIGEHRLLVAAALLRGTAQLRKRDYGYL